MIGQLSAIAQGVEAASLSPVLNALPRPLLVIDPTDRIALVNLAAEQFFQASAQGLTGQAIGQLLPSDSPVLSLIQQVRRGGYSVSEHGITVETPRIGPRRVSIDLAPVPESAGNLVVLLDERSIARKLDHQLVHRHAARSVTAMAAMLAHEVKNPLSGIRGAAQLLEGGVGAEDRELTRLICDEADRIVGLVDRMEMFSDERPIERSAVNIHEVLDHVRRLAASGFAREITFTETYDPSLPPVLGNRDLLVQALLNLVKNAAESTPQKDGTIELSTSFHQGLRLTLPGSGSRVELPLAIGVRDNGPGVPEDLHAHLFDPFVSTKSGGRGLGLALVAKIVGDHGGLIEFENQSRGTLFRLMLPAALDLEIGQPTSPAVTGERTA